MGKIDIDVGKKTDESVYIQAFSTATEKKWEYSIDGGKTWPNSVTTNSSSATIFIDGLKPNTEYRIGVRTNIFNEKYIYVKTLDPLDVYSPSDVYIDSKNPQLTFTANIPTGFFNNNSTTVYIRRVNEQMGTKFVVNLKNGKNSIRFVNPDIIDEMLRTMSKSKDMVFTAQFTYSKNSEKYSTTFTFHCKTTAENSSPILEDFVYQDNDPKALAVTQNDQLLITNESDLVVNITPATPKNYSAIVAYTVTVGDVSKSTVEERVNVGRIGLSGIVPIVVTAIDSRGYTATLTKIVEYIPYKDIEITELTIDRTNSVDETVYLRLKSAITPIYINGENRNGLGEIRYQTMRTDGEEVSESLAIPLSRINETDTEITVKIDEWLTFNEKNSYYIYLYVSDKLTKDEETVTLKNGRPVMSFRKEKVGINNNDPQYALDIVGDLNLTGKILINGEEIDLGGITE